MTYLTIREAAQMLGLHPQTVYRKCQRYELPSVHFGRTVRIPVDQLNPKKARSETERIPSFMRHLFWEYDLSQLKSSDPIILERVLELGDLPEWRWLESRVAPHHIRHFLEHGGKKRLSPRNLFFWSRLFGVKDENRNSTENPTEPLETTSWR